VLAVQATSSSSSTDVAKPDEHYTCLHHNSRLILLRCRDVFLRELISNAADACDKKRFLSITDSSGSDDAPEGRIRVKADKEARTLTIEDSGIGMTKEELINNLGRIAQVRAFGNLQHCTQPTRVITFCVAV
jgi:Histidine kinase-, DNA gyrase B-, and HSP90-like ATPase